MDFAPSEDLDRLRSEVRAFLDEHLTDEVVERVHRSGSRHDWDLHRALAERGWIGAGWPVEEGGAGWGPFEVAVFQEECDRRAAPLEGLHTTMMAANTIRRSGQEHHRSEILPRVLRGEILLALGYSEPEAGSDVAAVRTRAVRDGDGWVIDGEKVFTSFAHEAAFVFLLARTDPELPKHRGLTLFLVPTDAPGVSIHALHTVGGVRTNRTTYDGVRVPDRARVSEVNGGWDLMTLALAFERGYGMTGQHLRLLDLAEAWARRPGPESVPAIHDPVVRERLVRLRIDAEVARLLTLRTLSVLDRGGVPSVEGSVAELFATESFVEGAARLLDLAGPEAVLRHGEPGAPADGWLEHAHRHAPTTTIYGGTSEIQRSIIAERGLGLPRSR